MNFPIDYIYHLSDRGGAGLSCDAQGVALGSAELARLHLDDGGLRRCEVRSPSVLAQVLKTAFGPQPDTVVQRLHRGLSRAAAWLEAGDLCHAGVEAVMLRIPDLTPTAVAKLAEFSDLEKRGDHWKDEPRLPVGQAGGGQWTTVGSGSAASGPDRVASPLSNLAPFQSVLATPPIDPAPTLDDGVYRPGRDGARFIQIGEPPEDTDGEASYRSNGGPPLDEVPTLQEMFPGLKDHPYATAIMAPLDHFIGFSSVADEMNLAATVNMRRSLVSQIKALDPHFSDDELFPDGGVAGLSWEGRANLINHLLMVRASALFRLRGDASQLQVETLKFLRTEVDAAYADAVRKLRGGDLKVRLSDQQALGSSVDRRVHERLKRLYDNYNIKYGKNEGIINDNRDYNTSSDPPTHRRPDLRIGNISFDWTVGMKTVKTDQIRGFFAADSKPIGVVIIVPTQIKPEGAYYIPRPLNLRKYFYVPEL